MVGPGVSHHLNELLEAIKQEFVHVSTEASAFMMHKDENDHKLLAQHMNEITQVRKTIYELDLAHRQMKERYEDEIVRLKQKLASQQQQPTQGPQEQQSIVPPRIGPNHSSQSVPPVGGPRNNVPGSTSNSTASPPVSVAQKAGQASPTPAPPNIRPLQGVASQHQIQRSQVMPQGLPQAVPPPQAVPQGPKPPNMPSQQSPPPVAPQMNSLEKTQKTDEELGNNLAFLDIEQVPPNLKKIGQGYTVVYNKMVPPRIDVELVQSLEHQSVVCCVRFSADGRLLATGCNRCAQVFNVHTGELLAKLQDSSVGEDQDLYIRSVCFSPDSKLLATGAEDHQIRLWDVAEKKIKHVFSGHTQDIYSLDFSSSGRFIASGSGDRTVRIWDVETGQSVLTLQIEDGVTAVSLSPDGRYVVAGSLDKVVRVWDAQSGFLVDQLDGPNGHEDSVYSVAFLPNGREVVSGSLDRTIKVWELGSHQDGNVHGGKCKRTIQGHRDYVLSVAAAPDGQWIFSGSKDRTIQMWDSESGQAQLMLQAHVNSVISVAPSPVGRLFASGSGDFWAKIWRYGPRT